MKLLDNKCNQCDIELFKVDTKSCFSDKLKKVEKNFCHKCGQKINFKKVVKNT